MKVAAPSAALVASVLAAIFGPKVGGVQTADAAKYLAVGLAFLLAHMHAGNVTKVVKKITPKKKPKPTAVPAGHVLLHMFDTIDVHTVPPDAQAVAGYVGGHWPTFAPLVRLFPHALHLSIAVNHREDAQCLDVEAGDATPGEAGAWVIRQHARGIARPVVYCSISLAPTVLAELAKNGIGRDRFRLWSAHYTGVQHICSPQTCAFNAVTADATQYTSRALGRNLDESLCTAAFFS